MRNVTKLVSSAAFAIAFVTIGTTTTSRAAVLDCGVMDATGIVTVTVPMTTASQTFTPITAYSLSTTEPTCVHVQFTAQFRSKTPRSVQLRATVDGAPAGFPNLVTVSTSAAAFDDRTVTFIIPRVSTDSQIGIQVRSGDGTAVNIRSGLLQVQHENDSF
jgi:hypothetical protein